MGACLSSPESKGGNSTVASTSKGPSPEEAFNYSSGDHEPKHRVKLAISCKNLAVSETSGYQPPDPYASLYVADSKSHWVEISRTETLQSCRDPDFDRPMLCAFQFERPQRLKVTVRSHGKSSGGQEADSSLGEAEFTLRELVTARGNRLQLPLQDGAMDASCTLIVLDASNLNSELICRLQVDSAPLSHPGRSQVFLRAVSHGRNGEATPVLQTQAVSSGERLQWSIETPLVDLCNGDYGMPLTLEVWEYDGSSSLVGAVRTDLRGLQNANGSSLALSGHGRDAGELRVSELSVRRRLSFLDYMAGGCEIQCMIALDFSANNPPTDDPASSHYAGPDGQSASVFERSMAAFGATMQFYDPLRSFPLWGFGRQGNKTCWALNGQQFQPEVKGLRGLLRTYRKALHRASFQGPALFAPVVGAARDLVEQLSLVQHRYFLLVILTTSTGNDLEEFRASLVQAATDLALSVIVVGLGSADFRPLEEVVNSQGQGGAMNGFAKSTGSRNMAQFITLRKGADYDAAAETVLAKLPGQFMEYFHKRGIIPKTFSSDLVQQTKAHIARARSNEQ